MRFPLNRPAISAVASLCLTICSPIFASDRDQPSSQVESAGQSRQLASSPANQVVIPGPLRSFLRMAGISRDISLEDVLPTVGHSAYQMGYQSGRESEYLILLQRYVRQARELQALATDGNIRVLRCEDAGPLLQ